MLALWMPDGSNRPYEVQEQITANQKSCFYCVRCIANTVKASRETQQELINLMPSAL